MMKNTFILLTLLASFSAFSQKNPEEKLNPKKYEGILAKQADPEQIILTTDVLSLKRKYITATLADSTLVVPTPENAKKLNFRKIVQVTKKNSIKKNY